jgi:hypothetical membrane protein
MRLYTVAAGLLTAIILVAHAVAPAPYSWTLLSMSHLGAQGYEYAYIMRFGLVSYGAIVVVAAILKIAKRPRTGWPHGFIGIYGFAILLTGFFSTAPFLQGVSFSKAEANLHSTLASLAGIALSAAMVAFAVMAQTPRGRIIHLATLLLTLLVPEVFFKSSDAAGVLQRLVWLVVLGWFAVLEIPSLQADFRQPPTLPSASTR